MSNSARFKVKNGLDNGVNTIINVADPVNAQDAMTKNYGTNASNISSGTLAAALLPAFTGDVTSPAGSNVNTLATVNSNVGTFQGLTVNAKGLVTAASNQNYLTAEVDTLSTVTGRGATTGTAISITNATASTSSSTGALIVTGGIYSGANSYFNGNIGVGGTPVSNIGVYGVNTDSSSSATWAYGLLGNTITTSGSGSSGAKVGVSGVVDANTGFAGTGGLYGVYGSSAQNAAVSTGIQVGVYGIASTTAAGTIASLQGMSGNLAINAASTVTNAYGLNISTIRW